MPTNEEILKALEGLPEEFDVHLLEDAWYSEKALTRAFGGDFKDLPAIQCVRIGLPRLGCVECHPTPEGKIKLMCYCCFGGNPEQGEHELVNLKDAVAALKDHSCPPWPG